MAQLLVRGLREDTVRRLKERAAEHGRSVEAEHRLILEAAIAPPMTTAEWVRGLQSGPLAEVFVDLDIDDLRPKDTGREFDWP